MFDRAKIEVARRLDPKDSDGAAVDTFIIVLIGANVLAVMLETEPYIADNAAAALWYFEVFSSVFFTIEYVLRLWTCDLDPRYAGHPVKGRLKYIISPMAMVDLVAVLPFYLSFIKMDLRVVRAIRLLRLVRILKMGRYAHAVTTITNVIGRKAEELAMTSFVFVMLLVVCSSAIYFVEHTNQPEEFSSIPSAMWWTTVTLTSVGYGDVTPTTGIGKFVGAVVSMLGVLFVALPTGILASGFNEEIREQRRGKDSDVFGFCPHCGEQLIPGEELE